MRPYTLTAAAAACATLISCATGYSDSLAPTLDDRIVYDEPANIWEETLPLGNGRLGCMPDGAVENEHIVLNDISMWAGSEADYCNPDAATNLPKIRQLLFEGKNYEAQELMYKSFVPKSTSGGTYGSFQMLGNLHIATHLRSDAMSNYERRLEMSEGVAYTAFDIDGTHYERQYFASRHDDVIAIRYTSQGKPMSLTARLSRPERGTTSAADGALAMTGELNSGCDTVSGVRYSTLMRAVAPGATMSVTDSTISVSDANEVTFLISSATSLLFPNDFEAYAKEKMERAVATSFASLKSQHMAKHGEMYGRVRLHLTGNGDSTLTTDKRIANYGNSNDPAMATLYYNFGRYSLISSTRADALPPNLQGLWANECGTPWNGDYHTNINVQMNHWPLEQGNLTELYEPLIALVERAIPSGERSAKAFYGADARGWVMHMMTNVWNFTAPGDHPSWGATNTGGAWLCAHLWEHYEYTLDTAYLQRIYPILKGAAEFFQSTMVVEPKHRWLVTAPTSSPENEFLMDGYDSPISICMGPTMDTQLITELFGNTAKAAEILGTDAEFAQSLLADIKRLPPMQIAKEGYLMEWLEDYREADVHHRHVSHLYGLHPSNQISPINTPELAQACRMTLDRRGDGGTGWSRAWKINFWARLADGNRALALFKSLLHPAVDPDTKKHGSGTFPNLWCSHPPFQLDGNFGGAAGIGEMLLQSHNGFIDPLPALPDSWSQGSVTGMKVRGGAEVSIRWDKGQLTRMSIGGGKANSYTVALPKGMTSAKVTVNGATADAPTTERNGRTFITVVTNGKCAVISSLE